VQQEFKKNNAFLSADTFMQKNILVALLQHGGISLRFSLSFS
jgi:hypothetical protein